MLKPLRLFTLAGCLGMFTIATAIPLRLAIALQQKPHPQAILMLSGDSSRTKFTREMAQEFPDLPIWVSVGDPEIRSILDDLDNQGLQGGDRIQYDNRATDTVTNFTTMVAPLQQNNIRHVYLVTSDYHMPRSQAIATIVFGSQGIAFTPVSVPSQSSQREALPRISRDIGRSVLWLVTGRTGASFNPRLQSATGNSRS
ncbi:YdcF family protein [Nodularia spumigena]|uniref:YdcF family protein n=1 Tax=Nodularia spumigena TaxID=70799 RepID=UPI002B211335|nr:YdcF family protein [Nodularia spumigena]MEA5559371.1 YdcF family protein [Nodularia spumigena CH309]